MPTVEKTAGGRVNIRGLGEFSVGDRADVTDGEAEYLVEERGDFEAVDDVEEDGPPAVDEWHDWSEEDWLELGYQERADDVREGRVDGHLEDIANIETSDTVTDAVDERLDELEG